jgi:hypothetical protein
VFCGGEWNIGNVDINKESEIAPKAEII